MSQEIADYVKHKDSKVKVLNSRVVHSDGVIVAIESEFDSYVSCSVPRAKRNRTDDPFICVWLVGTKQRSSELFFPGYKGFRVFSASSEDKVARVCLISSNIS